MNYYLLTCKERSEFLRIIFFLHDSARPLLEPCLSMYNSCALAPSLYPLVGLIYVTSRLSVLHSSLTAALRTRRMGVFTPQIGNLSFNKLCLGLFLV